MINHKLIFVHGWGCGPDIWRDVINELPNLQTKAINLGFIGEKSPPLKEQKATYITHSLGTMWTLKNQASSMDQLIAINGFTSFKSFTKPRTLKSMSENLKQKPNAQMHDFWQTTNLPHYKDFNIGALQTGLEWLRNWNCSDILNTLNCKVSALYGDNDPILPTEKMNIMWKGNTSKTIKDGGHDLPITHPKICAEFITERLNEH